jgi:RNA polymerase subunit RPABC4/transcription elongation factor Spt4
MFTEKKCPNCMEMIKFDAKLCPYCRSDARNPAGQFVKKFLGFCILIFILAVWLSD